MEESNFEINTSWHNNNVGGLLLTDYQVDVLQKNHIDLNNSISRILMQINDVLEDEENIELEQIGMQIDEMYYYKQKKN